MIKLMEIKKLGDSRTNWTLSEIYIRPEYVISVSDDTSMKEMNLKENLIEGMTPEASFTKVVLSDGRTIRVVGPLPRIAKDLGVNTRTLLKD